MKLLTFDSTVGFSSHQIYIKVTIYPFNLSISCIFFFLTDTVHPLNFDWTRSDVEPLWLYEHVEAAKWNVQEVAAFVK